MESFQRITVKMNEQLTEEELFCDVEETENKLNELSLNKFDNDYDEESDDYSDYDDDYLLDKGNRQTCINQQKVSSKVSNYQPTDNLFKRYSNKINVDNYDISCLPQHTTNRLMESQRKQDNERIRTKDKHDRATAEQVMDPRTRMILFKLLNRNLITEVNGCISTGKEANVYHASSKTGQDYAIKIYKTSILVFKDRDKYVTGEYRFRHGYCKHNPRKMVKTWAEKEMRNLVRMHVNGLNVPEPILLRSHVLVMAFLGKNGKSYFLN